MLSMVGSVIWIPIWIYYGVVVTQVGEPLLAIAAFFVPVGVTVIFLGKRITLLHLTIR